MAQGKLGIALLKNTEFLRIILYLTKDNVLSTVNLKPETKVYLKQEYLQYQDDTGTYWSLHFANNDDRDQFLYYIEQVAVVEREASSTVVSNENEGQQQPQPQPEPAPRLTDKKDAVVSRVAKVGHQLPKLDFLKGQKNDSDSSSSSLSPKETVPRKPPPFHAYSTVARASDQAAQPSGSKNELFSFPQNLLANIVMQQNNTSSSINNFLTESRVHSSESRVNITKLETKIDRVLDKIDLLKMGSGSGKTGDEKDDEILELEEKVIELKKENRTLKLQIKDLGNPTANNKPLISNGEASTPTQHIYEDLESKRIIENLRRENEIKVREAEDLKNKIQELETKLGEERAKAEKLSQIQQKNAETPSGSNPEMIRAIMNDLYQKLFTSLNQRNMWPKQDVLKITADLIRSETKAALGRHN